MYGDNLVYFFVNDGKRNPVDACTFNDDDDKEFVATCLAKNVERIQKKYPKAKIKVRIYGEFSSATIPPKEE